MSRTLREDQCRSGRKLAWAAALALAASTLPAGATVMNVTVEAPTVQSSTATFSVVGIETFDGLSVGRHTFSTDFGTGGVITGTYTNVPVVNADKYGGAGGTGQYAGIESSPTTYTISSLTTNDVLGVNYFGLWISALNSTNNIDFYSDGSLVYAFTPADLLSMVGSNSAYFGNPNAAFLHLDATEPYAFVNFFDTDGTFDEVVVSGQGYESDNQTVGLFTSQSGTTVVPNLPEPASALLFGAGLLGLTGLARRRRLARV